MLIYSEAVAIRPGAACFLAFSAPAKRLYRQRLSSHALIRWRKREQLGDDSHSYPRAFFGHTIRGVSALLARALVFFRSLILHPASVAWPTLCALSPHPFIALDPAQAELCVLRSTPTGLL